MSRNHLASLDAKHLRIEAHEVIRDRHLQGVPSEFDVAIPGSRRRLAVSDCRLTYAPDPVVAMRKLGDPFLLVVFKGKPRPQKWQKV